MNESQYKYKSKSSKPHKRIKREIGFQLFCHRHKYNISVKEVCEKTNVPPKELDNIERIWKIPSPFEQTSRIL